MRQRQDLAIEVLQIYHITGKPFDCYVYFHSLSLAPRSSVVTKRLLDVSSAEETLCGEDMIRRRIEEDTQAVIAALESYQAVQVVYLRLSYLVERGNRQVETKVPWLMFAEECIIAASNHHRPIQLDAEPKIRRNRTPPRLKSRIQRQITSLNTSIQPDPQLSIVTLSSIHPSKLLESRHKSTHEILADLKKRQIRYGLYRSLQVQQTSDHSRTFSSYQSHQTLESSIQSSKLHRTDSEMLRKEVETNTPAEEGIVACALLDQQTESKYTKRDMSGKGLFPSALPVLPLTLGKCPGDYCAWQVSGDQVDPKRRFSIKRRWIQIGKLEEFSPLRLTELLIPSSDVSAGHRSEHSVGYKGLKTVKKPYNKLKSPLIHSTGELNTTSSLQSDKTEVCFRCFVVYENLRKLLE